MSDNKILAKYAALRASNDNAAPAGSQQADEVQDFGAFGVLADPRGHVPMLELRKANGNILAVGCGWLDRAEFTGDCILLHVGQQAIRIKGRNLNAAGASLFHAICQHRVVWIQEADEPTSWRAGKGATVIERFQW